MNCIFIKHQDGFRKILFSNILYLEAAGSYCLLHLNSGDTLTVTYTLAETAQYLYSHSFVRVHRSFVVNIESVESYSGNMFYIGKHIVPIGRQYKKEALAHFNILGAM